MAYHRAAEFVSRYDLPDDALAELEAMLDVSLVDRVVRSGEPPVRGAASVSGPLGDDPDARYQVLDLIGRGGAGRVLRVLDRELHRVMAMKVLDADPARLNRQALARFVEEAQATAQLQHPSIVPVHELGTLPDGRMYFTMKEVRGRTFTEVIAQVHEASVDVWARTRDGWTLRRLVEAFRRVCEAVAYAHSRGVVHRDLKPDNIMVGAFGEVQVMDWGLALVLDEERRIGDDGELPITTLRSEDREMHTMAGTIAGTPAYMSPEQAMGERDQIGRHTDVYALGAVLHYVLRNGAPFTGAGPVQIIYKVVQGDMEPLVGRKDGPLLPAPLVAISKRAMQSEPSRRYPDAAAMAEDIAAWLDGAERREAALRAIESASEARRRAVKLHRRAKALRSEAEALLEGTKGQADHPDKLRGWDLEDEALDLERSARHAEANAERQLGQAFAHTPELPEAHLALARLHQRRHQRAEAEGDVDAAHQFERLATLHLEALSPEWPGRARLVRYFSGTGKLTLHTTAPATVELFRFTQVHRRLEAVRVTSLGSTPLDDVALDMGSYLLRLRSPAGVQVDVPVFITRQHHWDGAGPDGVARALHIPGPGDLGPDEVLVPGGWFVGGDRRAPSAPTPRQLWCPTFAICRDPVTVGAYTAFLDTLPPAERDLRAPRGGSSSPDAPVTGVRWHDACAFAAWRTAVDGRAWRLPSEHEWEKAARGVDGRVWPWGDFLDRGWCVMGRSATRVPEAVDAHSADVGPYGVRGMAGNAGEWCASPRLDAADFPDRAEVPPADMGEVAPEQERVVRGGSFVSDTLGTRCGARFFQPAGHRSVTTGFRLARDVP